jgi:hypothetical protein
MQTTTTWLWPNKSEDKDHLGHRTHLTSDSDSWTSKAKDCALRWHHHNLWKQGFWANYFPMVKRYNWIKTTHQIADQLFIQVKRCKAYLIHYSKLAIPGTPIVQPLFLNPQSSVYFAIFSQGWIALSYLWRSDQLLLYSDMFMCLNFDTLNFPGQLESQELSFYYSVCSRFWEAITPWWTEQLS